LIDLLFHMAQLINRNNAKSYHAKGKPIVSENRINENTIAK